MKRSPMKRSGFTPKPEWKRLERSGPIARRTRLKSVGKVGQRWIDVRKDMKQRYEWAGITTCEARLKGCWFHDALSFAHCKKRRLMQGDDIWHTALLCTPCHNFYEGLPHEEMHDQIHAIIGRRGLIAPPSVLQRISAIPNTL